MLPNVDQFKTIMSHPKLKGIKNSASNMWLRRELILMKQEMLDLSEERKQEIEACVKEFRLELD